MNDHLAILTVTVNPDTLHDLIESLQKQSDTRFQIFVTNYAQSKSHHFLQNKYTQLNRINKGYAFGINEGIKEATQQGYSQFCVINDDTFVDKHFVKNCRKSLSLHPRSLIGGKIYYAPGYEYHKERYEKNDLGHVIWFAGGSIDWQQSQPKHTGVDEIDSHKYDSLVESEFITGCLMCFDNQVVDLVGFVDESYFLYYEDADYSERAKRAGIKLYYDPSLIIWHKVSSSTGGSGSTLHRKYQRRNLLRFALKYAPLKTKLHVIKNYLFDRFT